VLFSLMSLHVEAHDPGLSAVDLQVEKSGIAATLTLALADVETLLQLDLDRDGEITTAEIAAARSSLEALASSSLEVRIDERPSSPTEVEVRIDESNAVHFRLRFEKEHDSHLSVRSLLIAQLPRGHRQYMAINDSAGNRVAERVLDAKESGFQLSLDEPTASIEAPRSFSQFLLLGIEHILTGYDHLVFLLGLLIAGVSFRSAAGIITSFTVAHSVTLALATLDIVRIPSGVVEPLIAVSIVYVGVENISRRELNRRWLLTFGFGLIHGFGFASVLNELGVASSGAASAAVPLLSFNLGVELGQIAIAAVVWPVIWKLREKPSFVSRFVPACSVLIALAGGLWLIERTMLK
jgi:hydrogenase/urease accessory protein HupE